MPSHRDSRRDVNLAHGRYSASDQGDDRRREEVKDHGVYGYGPQEGPGFDREEPLPRHGRYREDRRFESSDHYDRDPGRPHASRDRYNSGYGGREFERYGERAGVEALDHRGKGPRGYTRADERVREDVCDSLTEDSRIDASDIDVTVAHGEVTLNGRVENRYAKRRAEELAERERGVLHVQNNLRTGEVASRTAAPERG